ncbi:MAG TPA: (2Fe-2S)-binding protein [Acidimicrobiales bacterium]|nr:(2Fe-2S)-binding protein [Acidimicrobiales bacterium]
MKLRATVNGQPCELDVEATSSLLDTLRKAGLTGTKEGCRIGVCGLCTVLVNDAPVSSCLYLAPCADGAEIWTVEGMAEAEPHLVQAFVEKEAMQCGICTPGQVMTAAAARRQGVPATDADIRRYLEGSLCRCTGYRTIVDAVKTYLAH